MTTSDYLTQLQQDKQDLVDNLETMGITGLTGDETFTELVPEVLNISGGGSGLDWGAIGYSSEPQSIIDDYNISKQVYDNWVPAATAPRINNNTLKYMPLVDMSIVEDASNFLNRCTALTDVPLLNTENIKYFSNFFANCTSLKNIPLLDTSNAISANNMFTNCLNLTTIPQFNFSKMQNISGMFYGCTNLITVPQLNTSSVNNVTNLFFNCSNLTTIPQFDFSNVTAMSSMFTNIVRKLTNESLNNLLGSLASATSYTGTKTLIYLFNGTNMSSYYSASKIQGLSNYQAFIDAGWTIGW